MKDAKVIKELEKKVQGLMAKYEPFKVNLTLDETSRNGEGIWAVPATDEDYKKSQNGESDEETFTVVLLNQPISWYLGGGSGWGQEVVARTSNQFRFCARLSDNKNWTPDQEAYDDARRKLSGK